MDKDIDRALAARYTGSFLDSADMAGDPAEFTIKDVIAPGKAESADGRPIKEAVLVFEETKIQLILNKTNIRILKIMFGRRAAEWAGKKVTIAVRYMAEAFGVKNAPCLRVIPPKDTPLPPGVRKWMGNAKPMKVDE